MMSYPLAQVKEYFFSLVPELDDEKWRLFEQVSTLRTYRKGDYLLRPGQVENVVSFVNKGLIRMYYLLDGKELTSTFFHENCYYSDYESFLSRQPSLRFSEVLEDTEVVDISHEDLQWLYEQLPECERAGRRVAEGLFVMLANRSNSFLMKTPEERYLEFIEEFPTMPQRVPQYMIASYLGVTPEALSRIRSRMSRRPPLARFVDSDQ
jgi:CRP/FNR family transcriptional regulator, anaerobic regulatory protein